MGKAVQLVAFGATFPFIEYLLRADPQIARRHHDELMTLLRPSGLDSFNLHDCIRSEYELFRDALMRPPDSSGRGAPATGDWLVLRFGQRNRILNRSYAFARDFEQALRLPWNEVHPQAARLWEKHKPRFGFDVLIDPFGSALVALDIEWQLKSVMSELLTHMHIHDAKLRLGTLLVHLTNHDVRDKDVPSFLASDQLLNDPFTGEPMKWNPEEGTIYFLYPMSSSHPRSKWDVFRLRLPSRNKGMAG